MHLLQAGVNLIWIRDLLGHTTIQTTEVYARADLKQKRVALERAYMDMLPDKAKDRLFAQEITCGFPGKAK
jgi:integrase/recombinase XerD